MTHIYLVISPSLYEYINLIGLVTLKIDIIIQNAKEESRDWYNKIDDM
jgi:hypothetical protein